MHLDEEQIQRALHSELRGGAVREVRNHLAECGECSARLAEAEAEETRLFQQLKTLDHSPPGTTGRSFLADGLRSFHSKARLVAGLLLAFGVAGIAYAAPGSPLPLALERLVELISPPRQSRAGPVVVPRVEEPDAGIAVAPGNRMTIEIASSSAGDTAAVALTDGFEVVVRAAGGTTTFESQRDHLVVHHRGAPALFEILIPRQAAWVELKAAGRSVLIKRGPRIQAEVGPNASGGYRLPLPR